MAGAPDRKLICRQVRGKHAANFRECASGKAVAKDSARTGGAPPGATSTGEPETGKGRTVTETDLAKDAQR